MAALSVYAGDLKMPEWRRSRLSDLASGLESRIWTVILALALPLLLAFWADCLVQRREALAQSERDFRLFAAAARAAGSGAALARPVAEKAGTAGFAEAGYGWLEGLLAADSLPPSAALAVVGPDGRLAFRASAGQGGAAPDHPWSAIAALAAADGGLRQVSGPGGEPFLYGVAALDSDGTVLALAIPLAAVVAAADRDLGRRVLVLALAVALAGLAGRLAVRRPVAAWSARLQASLQRFGAGEREVALPAAAGIRELSAVEAALGRLFDGIRAAGDVLDETRRDLALALDCAGLASWEWHLADGVRGGDTRFAEMLGYRQGAFRCDAAGWEAHACPEDRAAVQAALDSHVGGAVPFFECECRLRHRDGHWLWVLVRGRVAERDAGGRPLRIAGVALDVSARKLTELALRERTEELVALFDAIPAPVWMARDRVCREIVGNRAANRIYDMPDGANVSLSDPEVRRRLGARHRRPDGSEYGAEELPMQRAAAEARPVLNCEIEIVPPAGRNVRLFGNAAPLFDDEGQVRGAVAAFIDITEVRAMDEALRRHETVLAQAGKMAHLGAWAVELDGDEGFQATSIFWADETFRLFGYQPGEVTPSVDLFVAHIHPDDRARVWAEVLKARAAGAPCCCEYRIVRRDGVERVVLDHGEFGRDAGGHPNFVGACQDITGRKAGELELVRHRSELESLVAERTYELAVAKEVAERASSAKSRFLANISHELRTPLNSLMLLARILADNAAGNLTPQQVEYAGMIELSGNDLLHLVDELLDLARIETGRLEVAVKSVPFPDIMQNVQRLHRHVARQKGLDFRMEIDPDVPASISTDPLRLQQSLRNLLSNAIKFTREGSVSLRIRRAVSGWRYGNPALAKAAAVVAFDIVDTGVGIPAERQALIVEAFEQFQSRPTREYGGIGLGLTIASEIAALLGGELALTSAPGQGSTFTVFLPLTYQGPGRAAPSAAAETEPAAAEPLLAERTVLVVDDDQRNRFALTAMLEKRGMRVLAAAGGIEALDLLEREAVDVVLLDIMMPCMDGYEVVRAIRTDTRYRRLPVIAVTADALPATGEQCLAAGFSDYLSKPIGNDRLLARLRQWLAQA